MTHKRVIFLLLTTISLSAWICDLPSFIIPKEAIPTAESMPIEQPFATSSVQIIEPPLVTTTTVMAVTVVQLHPQDGGLMMQINGEVKKATAIGQQPIVEFDASW